jgi:hypothetical protein
MQKINRFLYHKACSVNRKLKPRFDNATLIHMLINLKSYYGNIYRNKEIIEQLRFLKNKSKTKEGDVKVFFWINFKNYIHYPSDIVSKYGERYNIDDLDILPF